MIVKRLNAILIAVAALTVVTLAAGDMELTLDDGTDIVLHEDNAWSYKKSGYYEERKDEIVHLNDGRILMVNGEQTWQFITKAELAKMKFPPQMDTLFVMSTSENKDLETAKAEALKSVKTKALTKLYQGMGPKVKNIDTKRCFEANLGAYAFSTENFSKLWKAKITIELNKKQILELWQCATAEPEAPAEAAPAAAVPSAQ